MFACSHSFIWRTALSGRRCCAAGTSSPAPSGSGVPPAASVRPTPCCASCRSTYSENGAVAAGCSGGSSGSSSCACAGSCVGRVRRGSCTDAYTAAVAAALRSLCCCCSCCRCMCATLRWMRVTSYSVRSSRVFIASACSTRCVSARTAASSSSTRAASALLSSLAPPPPPLLSPSSLPRRIVREQSRADFLHPELLCTFFQPVNRPSSSSSTSLSPFSHPLSSPELNARMHSIQVMSSSPPFTPQCSSPPCFERL